MIAHDAFSSLVNLSDTLLVARHLVDPDFLAFVVSFTAVSLALNEIYCETIAYEYAPMSRTIRRPSHLSLPCSYPTSPSTHLLLPTSTVL